MSDVAQELQVQHRAFSVAAYNEASDILWEPSSTPQQLLRAVELAHVAHFHWSKRQDHAPLNEAVGLTLLSWAYASAGIGDQALSFAGAAIEILEAVQPLPSYFGYAHANVAVAMALLGQREAAATHFRRAEEYATRVPNADAKRHLDQHLARYRHTVGV